MGSSIPGGAFVLFCSCGCATWFAHFQMVVDLHSPTMHIPKRNFSGWKPLPLPGTRFMLDRMSQYFRFRNPWFLSQAGRPGKAQLGKSGRNLAPGCWESCLEWPGSRLFRNHKFHRIKLNAKFFRFGIKHFKYRAMLGQIFPYTRTHSV
ncbi:hypothetical protein T4B_7035 [Trichinella pseudospiralis]|uniref:Secreted protein n=1 Tax=Trichinella pseudospiralis TaxID=6337 RepID=A0A0V1JQ28_TRIPS|nr:hypothetical protein T4A_10039 [Trichinella pseudospiralis]KRZ33296.1 hypothetical protein T4B_7035 [Trichinella pseudospiralis]KRZ37075.1 hypothetical protein T4C_14025 [Trichinella pseudospiralis]